MPLGERILNWLAIEFWSALALAAATGGFMFLNATIGMKMWEWLVGLRR